MAGGAEPHGVRSSRWERQNSVAEGGRAAEKVPVAEVLKSSENMCTEDEECP